MLLGPSQAENRKRMAMIWRGYGIWEKKLAVDVKVPKDWDADRGKVAQEWPRKSWRFSEPRCLSVGHHRSTFLFSP